MTDTRQIEREDATNAYVTELRAEIERLRAENQRLTLLVQSVVVASGGYIAEPRLEMLQRQKAEVERLRAALQEIEQWSHAYPLSVFPEPDLMRASELLRAGGITLDAISAYAMRHVARGVGEIARRALEPKP